MKNIILTLLLLFASPLFGNPPSEGEQLLKQISKGFCLVAKEATPAVVFLESVSEGQTAQLRSSRKGPHENPFDFFGNDFFNDFFGFPQQQHRSPAHKEKARGTGFLISSDGYIVTNNHLVEKCNTISVKMSDGRNLTASVVGCDPKTDIAVLKIEGKDFPYLTFGNSDDLAVGDWLIAIGSPFGLQATVTVGIVSAKGRNQLQIADFEDFIQTDAAINPGNSGGPALDIEGRVIGVNTAIASASGGYQGIGFAIPSNMVKYVVDHLVKDGTVTRGYLGVSLQAIDNDLAEYYKIGACQGALVADVEHGSPADLAGLKQEDVILAYNGCNVENRECLRNAISMITPGTRVILKVKRDGKELDVPVIITALPGEFVGPNAPLQQLGLQVRTLTPELASQIGSNLESGVVVAGVSENSPAQMAGLKPGSIIVAVNRKSVDSVEEFTEMINASAPEGRVLLKVVQGESVRFIALHFAE